MYNTTGWQLRCSWPFDGELPFCGDLPFYLFSMSALAQTA
jgi:hypothetical protein